MYIGRIMHTDLITVTPDVSLVEANDLLEKKKISHLLVVDKNKKLVGILSDVDVKEYCASPATSLSTHELNYLLQKVLVKQIMVKTVITVEPNTTVERAAYIMQENRIDALPVLEDGELVGIITSTDVMEILFKAIGISEGSTRLSVFVKDSLGALAAVADTLREAEVNILSLFAWPEEDTKGITQFVIRLAQADDKKAEAALSAKGFKVMRGYAKDVTPYLPA